MRTLLAAAGLCAILVAVVAPARADDRTRAAEHFALAESAERRGDDRTAIAEYRRAYALSPHAAVLYNIALAHERLGEAREAASYFLRYLDEAPEAQDRDEVLAKVAALRQRPSAVRIEVEPAGATVIVDGEPRGPAPLEIELPGGEHSVAAERGPLRSRPRPLVLAFGEPATVRLDLTARPGILQVFANVDGAEVALDGAPLGSAPLSTEVPAGEHEVVVRAPGYTPVTRAVTVPADGSQQLRIELAPAPGAELDAAATAEAPGDSSKILVGTAYGWQDSALRYQLEVGARLPSDWLDASVVLGTFGADVGFGLGAQARLYLWTGNLRPYLRGGGAVGGNSAMRRAYVAEAAGGVLLSTTRLTGGVNAGYGVDYFVEAGAQWRTGGGDSAEDGDPGFAVPFTIGVIWRWHTEPQTPASAPRP